jgi:3-oxoacyl-[acyl-carrier protein] reductase
LASAGADVAVHDIARDKAAEFGEGQGIEDVVAEIRSMGRRAAAVLGNISQEGDVARIVAECEEALGPLDILVNNAGGDIAAQGGRRPEPNDCIGISADDVQAVLERNLLGTILCCRAVAPGMMARRHGRIVNVSSMAGVMPTTEGAIYATAKAGIAFYTRCLAMQLRPHDVNVNAIAPGPTWTARFAATRQVPDESGRSRLQRIAHPDDMAGVVEFLVGPLAQHVSGQVIAVNGGAITP